MPLSPPGLPNNDMVNEILVAARVARAEGRPEAAFARYEDALPLVASTLGPAAVADLLCEMAELRRVCGQYDLAREALELALTLAELNDLPRATCSAHVGMAALSRDRGASGPAERLYRTAREEAVALQDGPQIATIDLALGDLARGRGDIEGASRHYRAALAHFSGRDERAAMTDVLTRLGIACIEAEDWQSAGAALDRALALAEGLNAAAQLAQIEIARTELYHRSGSGARARECCDRAFDLYLKIQSDAGLAAVHRWYGAIHRGTNVGEAERHLHLAVDGARRSGEHRLEAEAMGEWAVLHLGAGRYPEAARVLNQAMRTLTAAAGRPEQVDVERRLDEIEELYLKVAAAWAESVEQANRYTAGHCERVATLAWQLGRQAGISGRDLTWLRIGAYLHDLGMHVIPASVLNKEDSLTEEEWTLMQSHTVEGDRVVAGLDLPGEVRAVVRSHHERWDGYGYPDGSAGVSIPLGARIVCLADVYDALTTDRSFRPAYPREEALRMMDSEVGRTFDPDLFLLFRALVLGRIPRRDLRFARFGGRASAA